MSFTIRPLGAGQVRVWEQGRGPALLYLHGMDAHPGDCALLRGLAATHRVIAPEHPGYGESTPAIPLHDITDQVLHLRLAVETWAAGPVAVIGHSLGGMFAAEFAALCPHLASRLVLIDAYGLWRDEDPLPDPFALPPAALAAAKWSGPIPPDAPQPTAANHAAATRFLWPIPDRGLARRLPFIQAPTLILHGENDGLIPAAYARHLANEIRGARLALIAGAAHDPGIEQPGTVLSELGKFLSQGG